MILKEQLQQSLEKNKQLLQEILELKLQLQELRRLVFGSKSERFVPAVAIPGQLGLFAQQEDATDNGQATEVVQTTVEKHTRKKSKHKGRTLLDGLAHLPVNEIEIEVEHSANSECIGQVERVTLAYTPGQLFINKEIIKKYKEPETGKITPASFPLHPISRCEAHISLLVYICVCKFMDHLPEYRQAQIFLRDGVLIASSSMNGWVQKVGQLLNPMAAFVGQQILSSGNIMIDESSIRVLKTKKNKSHTGWMWVIYSPALRCVQFMYHHGRTQDIPQEILKDYNGYYQTDGYGCYDTVDKLNKHANHAQCNAHARRYFEKALDNDRSRASHAMQVYQQLYKVESEIRTYREEHPTMSLPDYYAYRMEQRKQVLTILASFKDWLDQASLEVLPKSAIGKAIAYVLKRWTKLTKYATNGALEIDNNLIENTIRPLALGRKNYLFAGSPSGAENIAVFQTIFGTCKHMGINPTDYLTWYLERIATTNINQIETLSPWAYQKAMTKKDL